MTENDTPQSLVSGVALDTHRLLSYNFANDSSLGKNVCRPTYLERLSGHYVLGLHLPCLEIKVSQNGTNLAAHLLEINVCNTRVAACNDKVLCCGHYQQIGLKSVCNRYRW
eukprot:XP_001708554.1 Hypothetical protein GL50803_35636 [Giardia lamblia ATCC 50803]